MSRKLPMIVDIGIDDSGNKMFQVHETSKHVRHKMPTLSHFSDPSLFDSKNRHDSTDSNLDEQLLVENTSTSGTPKGSRSSSRRASSASPEEDIWCSDVQQAFEEVLAMVPKKGLNKIKIGGRSCGRNELISDYIMAKTGKYRSRKQVSSHIQVIKNMRLRRELIDLINHGPRFASDEEAKRNNKRFEEIFTKINLNKSLGVASIRENKSVGGGGGGASRRHSTGLSSTPKRKRHSTDLVSIKNIGFSIDNGIPGNNNILTFQEDAPILLLTLKENANFASRFPGLEEFASTNVPILHNMVRLLNPSTLPANFSIDRDLKTNYKLEFATVPAAGLCSYTSVYSFGTEVLKVNEDDFQPNVNQPFLLKFWKCFFFQLLQQPSSLDAAFKGITVKQVIYERHDGSLSLVPKARIKAVLLWEFSKVESWKEATSSVSRLFLPPSLQTPIELHDSFSLAPMVLPEQPVKQEYIFSTSVPQDIQYVKQEPVDPLSGIYQAPYYPQTPTTFHSPPPSAHTFHPAANVDLTSIRTLPNDDPTQVYGASYIGPPSGDFGP